METDAVRERLDEDAWDHNELEYLSLLEYAFYHGHRKDDRTGTGTWSVFGPTLHLDLQAGFPLLTTKRVNHHAVFAELCWMLRGSTNANELRDLGAGIWDAWADEDGELGPVYGKQWRDWQYMDTHEESSHDQLADLERRLREDPDDRRMVVSAWNVGQLDQMRLPPCHLLFQVWTREPEPGEGNARRLSLQVYQRSADLFIGLPFNLAGYAALTQLLAMRAGMAAEALSVSLGDAHVYRNHALAVHTQLQREARHPPVLGILDAARTCRLEEIEPSWFAVHGYDPHPAIRAPVAV